MSRDKLIIGYAKRNIQDGETITITVCNGEVTSPDIAFTEEGKSLLRPAGWKPEHENNKHLCEGQR